MPEFPADLRPTDAPVESTAPAMGCRIVMTEFGPRHLCEVGASVLFEVEHDSGERMLAIALYDEGRLHGLAHQIGMNAARTLAAGIIAECNKIEGRSS